MDTETETTPEPAPQPWPEGTVFCHMSDFTVLSKNSNDWAPCAITVAYRVDLCSTDSSKNTIRAGFAFCSPEDMKFRTPAKEVVAAMGVAPTPANAGSPGYQKSIGRTIAFDRLTSTPLVLDVRKTVKSAELLQRYLVLCVNNGLDVHIHGVPNSWVALAEPTDDSEE